MKQKLLIVSVIVLAAAAAWYFFGRSSDTEDTGNYIGNSAEECSRIQVMCIEGFERFDNARGCGCRPGELK